MRMIIGLVAGAVAGAVVSDVVRGTDFHKKDVVEATTEARKSDAKAPEQESLKGKGVRLGAAAGGGVAAGLLVAALVGAFKSKKAAS